MNTAIPVFFLGPKGTYGSEATKIAMSMLEEMLPDANFKTEEAPDNVSVLEMAQEANGVAVIPVENGQEGPVTQIMGWRVRQSSFPLQIIGEIRLPIHHHLLVRPGTKIETITHAVSHPQALGQCRNKLRSLGIKEKLEVNSTARAAEKISQGEFPESYAAIASMDACREYGLESLGEVADISHNETLFHVCAPWKIDALKQEKTVLIFDVAHQPDALLRVEEIFRGVNRTSIHSIATGKLGHYSFYTEYEIPMNSTGFMWRLSEMRKVAENVRILGSFPKQGNGHGVASRLEKKHVGIFGMGIIGKSVDHFCRVRGMDTFTYDNKGGNDVSLKELVEGSQVIFVAVPSQEVQNVLRQIAPHTRDDQAIVVLATVMRTCQAGKAACVNVHFNAAPRGLSFGGRKAFVSVDEDLVSTEARWILVWIQVFILEFGGDYMSVTVEEHNHKALGDKVPIEIALYLYAEVIGALGFSLDELVECSSPVSEVMLALLGKLISQGDMYAGIIEENEGASKVIDHMTRTLANLAVRREHGHVVLAKRFEELKVELGGPLVMKLAASAEKLLALVSSTRM